MNSIDVVKALYTTLNADAKLASLNANVVTGVGERNANYPCVTIMPVDDVPRHFQRNCEEIEAYDEDHEDDMGTPDNESDDVHYRQGSIVEFESDTYFATTDVMLATDDVPVTSPPDPPWKVVGTHVSFTTWDLKIWGKNIAEVSGIYDRVIEILETDISTEIAASFRGRGMPLMAEDNRPNEIIYSRVIECEVIF